jgi:DNA polymerase-3 subunit beta
MNIINNVFIHTDESFLYIEATDLEISYKGKVSCNIEDQGAITVNAKKFYEIIKEFPSDIIKIEELENYWIVIGDGDKAEYKIGGMSGDDFPNIRKIDTQKLYDIEANTIKELIEKTIFSVSMDDKKQSLTGILVEEERNENAVSLKMVSSDGHRLNICEKQLADNGIHLENNILIPRKGASEIRKLAENNDTLKIGVEDSFCFIQDEYGDNQIVVRLLNEIFPDYQGIIPSDDNRYFLCDNNLFFNALKRISILSLDNEFRGVKALLHKNIMEISSIENKIGEARELVKISYDGEPFTIASNARYLMDVLSIMNSETIKFIVNNEDSPFILKGDEDEGFTGIIMPMTIESDYT